MRAPDSTRSASGRTLSSKTNRSQRPQSFSCSGKADLAKSCSWAHRDTKLPDLSDPESRVTTDSATFGTASEKMSVCITRHFGGNNVFFRSSASVSFIDFGYITLPFLVPRSAIRRLVHSNADFLLSLTMTPPAQARGIATVMNTHHEFRAGVLRVFLRKPGFSEWLTLYDGSREIKRFGSTSRKASRRSKK